MLSIHTPFPIIHMLDNNGGGALCAVLSTYSFDKVSVRVCPFISHTAVTLQESVLPIK